MSNWEEYQTALKNTDEGTRDKIRSSLISDCVETTVRKHELDASHTKVLVGIYVDVLLDLITSETAVEQVRSAAIPAASEVHEEIWSCLQANQPKFTDSSQQITDSYSGPKVETSIVEKNSPTPTQPPKHSEASVAANLSDEIAETEAALNAIPKIRTMVQDAQESTTHTSSQSDLLKQSNRWVPKE